MPINEIRKLKGMDYAMTAPVAEKEVKVKIPKPAKVIPKESDNIKFIKGELKKLYPI